MIDSAGTHAYHIGEAPDTRSINTAKKRGVDISTQRARQIQRDDFYEFNLILALDNSHLQRLLQLAPKDTSAHIDLFLEYAGGVREKEVPDPYYGGQRDFENVYDMIETASKSLLMKLQPRLME